MLPQKIALIDQTGKIGSDHLAAVAAANQQHVNLNVAKYWPGISATITTMPDKKPIPPDTWPIFIVGSLPPGEGGFHSDDTHNQPYSVVANQAGWMMAVSHEVIEMCIDPFGQRLVSGPVIELHGGTQVLGNTIVSYIVEACDAPESHGFAIPMSGYSVALSDFVTPAFYQPATGGPFDHMRRIQTPFQILSGGYLSYMDARKIWWQIVWLGAAPQLVELGPMSGARSIREFIDKKSQGLRRLWADGNHEAVKAAAAMEAANP
jgi:hypothetical protein